jgi:hypothetical protein
MITKRIKIEQDGVILVNELRPFSPLAKKFRFDVAIASMLNRAKVMRGTNGFSSIV